MKLVMLDAGTLGDDLSLDALRTFGNLTVYSSTAPDQVAERLCDCEVAILNKIKMTSEIFDAAPHLRLVCLTATGFDNVDLDAARAHGVAVCNVPGYSTPSVVQVTIATVLSLATHLPAYAKYVRSGDYERSGVANRLVPVYHELCGKTWGVVGYGSIGRGVADVAHALGCRLLVCRRSPDGSPESCDIDTLCRESDIITLHTPLNDSTRGLISRERIALMKDGVILVNVARGLVTDEQAVTDAVLSGKIGGFGCDVFSAEPFGATHPFSAILDYSNVCLTPHMAWGSYEARVRCLETIAENIRAHTAGQNHNRVD